MTDINSQCVCDGVTSDKKQTIDNLCRVMGNGTSSLVSRVKATSPPPTRPPRSGSPELRTLVPKLQKEVREWEERAGALEAQVTELRRQVAGRDAEVLRLLREVHKLRVSTAAFRENHTKTMKCCYS